jgi:hypothetical protein
VRIKSTWSQKTVGVKVRLVRLVKLGQGQSKDKSKGQALGRGQCQDLDEGHFLVMVDTLWSGLSL